MAARGQARRRGPGRAGRAVPRYGPGCRRRGGARGAAAAVAAAPGGVTPPGGGRAAWGRGPAAMEGVLYKWTNYLSGELRPVLSFCAGWASLAGRVPSSSFLCVCIYIFLYKSMYVYLLSLDQRCPRDPAVHPGFPAALPHCHRPALEEAVSQPLVGASARLGRPLPSPGPWV